MNLDDRNIDLNSLSERELLILLNYKVNVMQGKFVTIEETQNQHNTEITILKENGKRQATLWGSISSAVVSGTVMLISKITGD